MSLTQSEIIVYYGDSNMENLQFGIKWDGDAFVTLNIRYCMLPIVLDCQRISSNKYDEDISSYCFIYVVNIPYGIKGHGKYCYI